MALAAKLPMRYNKNMRKSILLFCFICLALPGQYAFGQKTPKPGKALHAVLRPSKGTIASLTQGLTDKQLEQMILKLQRKNAAAERALAAQKATQEKAYSVARKAVFRALGPQLEATTLSGTLFKVNYNGQEEIFGVVPMHVLRDGEHAPQSHSYKFTAGVFNVSSYGFDVFRKTSKVSGYMSVGMDSDLLAQLDSHGNYTFVGFLQGGYSDLNIACTFVAE